MTEILKSLIQRRSVRPQRSPVTISEKQEQEVGNESDQYSEQLPWTPISLRLTSLICFVLLFSALGLSLLLIWHLAKRTGGFDLFLDNHYIWVYGPTAFLILIISLWRQLDYNCKVITPWYGLLQSKQKASRSILLDYISPLQVVTLYQAIVNHHTAVVFTTLGFFTLKLITIASTGLLVINFVHVTTSQDLLTTTRFNYPRIGDTLSGSNLTSPIYRAYGYLIQDMPFVDGVTANTTYQSITIPSGIKSRNVTYSAEVQSLSPSFKCQRLELILSDYVDPAFTSPTVNINFTYSTPCNVSSSVKVCYPASHRCASEQYLFSKETMDCGHEGETWWVVTNTQWLYNQTLDGTDLHAAIGGVVNASEWSFDIGNYSSWACKLEYDMQMARVTYDMSQSPPATNILSLNQSTKLSLPAFTAANLSREVEKAFSDAQNMLGDRDLFSGMMEDFVRGNNETFLQDPAVLGPVLETVFTQVATQVISQVAMQNTVTKVFGSIISVQARLQVSEMVLGFMGGGFIVMILITAAVIWTRPTKCRFSSRLDTIKHISGVLSQSSGFHRFLCQCHEEKESVVVKRLRTSSILFGYETRDATQNGHISTTNTNLEMSLCSPTHESGQSWWIPLTLQKAVLSLTILAPLVAIGVLEFLQHRSDQVHGFASIDPRTSVLMESFYARFAPAMVILLIATLFTSLDFNAAVLAPFNTLLAEHSSSYKIVSSAVLGKMSPLAMLIALEQKQWSAAFAATAAFIGSVLTIIVSGLYTIDLVPDVKSISLGKQDTFRLEWDNSVSDDGGAAVMLSMIEGANLSYPSLTYDGLVFPNLTTILDHQHTPLGGSGLIQATVPALRANLNCQRFVDPIDYNVTFTVIKKINNWSFGTQMAYPLPSNCLRGGPYGNESTLDFTFNQQFPTENAGMWYYASLTDLHVGPYARYDGLPTDEISPEQNPDNPPGCPTLGLNFGWVDTSRNLTSSDLMVCYQEIQQIETFLTLTYPNLTIPDAHPPIPNEQAISTLPSSATNTTAFPFRIQKSFKDSFSLFNPSSAYTSAGDRLKFDNFYLGVMFGKDNLDFSIFTNDFLNHQLLPATQTFYRRYMAQVMNSKMRNVQAVSTNGNDTLAATLALDSGVPRMFQHKTPKIILQAMLCLMFICGTLSLHLGRFHRVVPWNPCSIAGTSILFAGSRICKEEERPGPLRRSTTGSTITEIEDTDDGTPLIGSNRDAYFDRQNCVRHIMASDNPRAESLWSSFPTKDKERRAEEREEEIKTEKFDLRTAKLRLGWWKDGVFFGEHGPSRKEMKSDTESEKKLWRYGIDYLPSSAHNAMRCHCGNHVCQK